MIQPLLRWKRRLRVTTFKARRALQFPIPTPARVAVFDDSFSADRNIREFAADELSSMHQWAPEAIVAPLDIALSLADQKLRGLADLSSLRAAIVLTDVTGEALADAYRELLWQALEVPIFEQIRGQDGSVIARECEVHNGLHIDPLAELPGEWKGDLVKEQCECGSDAPRLRSRLLKESAPVHC